MGKKIYVGDVFNYINGIFIHISNKYMPCLFWFLLLVVNSAIIHSFELSYKNYPYDCEELVADKEFKNISECQDYFIFFQAKISQSKIILFYLWLYHIIFALFVILNNSFNKFYKNHDDNLNIANLIIYCSSSLMDKKLIILLNIKSSKYVSFCEFFYLYYEIAIACLIVAILIIIIREIYLLCCNLYENKIKNIEIIELPNDPVSQLEKVV